MTNPPKLNAPSLSTTLQLVANRIDHWITATIRLLPNIGVAIVVMLLFWVLSIFVRRLIRHQLGRVDRANLADVLGGFIKWLVLVAGFLFAATIVIPTLHPGDLVAGLGVSSIAIGFAFKDILQNWMAGLLLLMREPFHTQDQIEVNGYEGTVERIETRATIIRTYDGQRVVIPNSDIYTNSVLVKTAHDKRRSQYDIGIGYGDDLEHACEVIRDALAGVEDVENDPAPEALPWELAGSSVNVRARWWTDSRRADVVRVRARVILAVKKALDAEGIDMPYDTTVQLWHDQTEADDGNRAAQREGWPAAVSGPTEPRWRARRGNRSDERQTKTTTDGEGGSA